MTARSPSLLLAAVAAVDVEHEPDLQPGFGGVGWTHCNLAAQRILGLLDAPLPPGLLANQQALWLDSAAARGTGWYECSEKKAIERAAVGYPVVAAWLNPDGHGHIGVGVPGPGGATEIHVAAAGSSNHANIRRSGSFGPHVPLLYTHD